MLLALAVRPSEKPERLSDLASRAGLSLSEVHRSLDRSATAGLLDAAHRRPFADALLEFLVHGARYAFPAPRGAIVRGMPTSFAAAPLHRLFEPDTRRPDQTPVWASPLGGHRGYSIAPLYRTVPEVARRDPQLYEVLALVDALREGRARERDLAARELRARLTPA